MHLRPNIATSENGFVFNPATGDSFNANPLATRVIAMMRNGCNEQDIRDLVVSEYEVDALQAERDLEDFFATIKDFGLTAE